MELALYNSQETLIVAQHLKQLEDMKMRHEQVIKYADTFLKLSEDETVALMHIEQWCLHKDLEESLEVAETLKVLEEIVSADQ